jgi:DNA topoisomerase-3
MGKALFIAEKPSVAQEFAKALKYNTVRRDGYVESDEAVVTWCVGHLVTMSYPECYDPALKRWSLDTLPFIPAEWKYEVIEGVKKQFDIVSGLLNRPDVDTIYVCTDSGREGEYIYRLVEQQAHVEGKKRRRVWIDSQTEEEILRGIREAKDLSEYDSLADAAYLRAKEDYLMGINFSRVLTLKYGNTISNYLKLQKGTVIAVGRVMTCVQGMIVKREREIRQFVETPFYRVLAKCSLGGSVFEAEWRAVEGSKYFASPKLYKENGFNKEEDARALIEQITEVKMPDTSRNLSVVPPADLVITGLEKKKENKSAPLLFNLAELQNECSRLFKISPDETLRITQELYEKKLVTYPRTDARVLSTAVAKEIYKNINGLRGYEPAAGYAAEILSGGSYKTIAKTKYTNDKQITDHYAIIPTGQTGAVRGLSAMALKVYDTIVKRFLAIFYPPAVYQKVAIIMKKDTESLFSSFKVLISEGYLKVAGIPASQSRGNKNNDDETEDVKCDAAMLELLQKLKKGDIIQAGEFFVKEGKTSPPKRYNSGSLILAMENAGQLIEDEELRAQIKGSGIGTSATRAEILKKLIDKGYIRLNGKTQIITPTLLGEMIYDVVAASIKYLLDPTLTASWEKGLTGVADSSISSREYLDKLEGYVTRRTLAVKQVNNQYMLRPYFDYAASFYK